MNVLHYVSYWGIGIAAMMQQKEADRVFYFFFQSRRNFMEVDNTNITLNGNRKW